MRINKFLAERLGLSRREADLRILAGKVTIDGMKAKIGDKVDESNKVCYNNTVVPFLKAFSYIALNKPVGYVCSRKAQGENETIYALLPKEMRELKAVGRLDKDSEGLLILTNDGDFAFRMTHPQFRKEKKYIVQLDRSLAPLHQQMLADFGVNLKDGISRMGLTKLDETRLVWEVVIWEGRNRQIRRSFGALGYTVMGLKRVQFGKYLLGELGEGKWEKVEKM